MPFVTVTGAGAHDGTTEANAYDMEEAALAAVAGDVFDVKAGTYTAEHQVSNSIQQISIAGTAQAFIFWRAYTTTAGDFSPGDVPVVILDANVNSLNNAIDLITGFKYNKWQGFQMTGAVDTGIDGGNNVSALIFFDCKIDNNAGAGIRGNDQLHFLRCEFTQNGQRAMDCDLAIVVVGCIFHDEDATNGFVCDTQSSRFYYNQFYNNGAKINVQVVTTSTANISNSAFVGNIIDGDGVTASKGFKWSSLNYNVPLIMNNIFFDLDEAIINSGGSPTSYSYLTGHNLFSQCVTDLPGTAVLLEGDISNSIDPFTDSDARDYSLVTGSAAIDAGFDFGTT